MKKIEIIWRELLFEAIEKKHREFTQKELAAKFGFSTSTIFQALKSLRKMGAVRVTGRNFILEDWEKVLYHWASERRFSKDIIFQGCVDLDVGQIEGVVPPDSVFGFYKAALAYLNLAPADYDKVYLYTNNLGSILERYRVIKGQPNLFVIKADEFMPKYGGATTICQTFVDLWNLPDWYAKEYTRALKEKMDELLP